MPRSPSRRLRAPRMTVMTIITLCLLLALAAIRPEQLQVVLYKTGLVTLGAVVAYWIDRNLFPCARPHECLDGPQVIGAWVRRALITLACILGLTLGL
ncbi:putative holin [Pseudomonas paralcaligenes]|uniref:putative holin n=1 Tax=Pseudomonas paralcaligenes TaxID=2772558 RepID=UPI0021CFFF56|nr:putative holin [Pseudomonas paralcaligenes]